MNAHLGQTDHDLDHVDHLVPHLPLWEDAQDLHVDSTDPTQETLLDREDYTGSNRQHEVDHTDHTDHTDQEYLYLPKI